MRMNKNIDTPRKRIDKYSTSSNHYSQLAHGSPATGRRGIAVSHVGPRHQSCHTTPLQSPCTSPVVTNRDFLIRNSHDTGSLHGGHNGHHNNHNNHVYNRSNSNKQQSVDNSDNISMSSVNSTINTPNIRSRINSFKNSMFATPKFNKPPMDNQGSSVTTTPRVAESPDSKSWFQRWTFRPDISNTSQSNDPNNHHLHHQQQQQDKEKEFIFEIKDKPLNSVKADLIHAFLSIQDLIHNINSPTVFRCEFRSNDKINPFNSRNTRFRVEIQEINSTTTTTTNGAQPILTNNININNNNNIVPPTQQQPQDWKIVFYHLSGSTRQFNVLCNQICKLISLNYSNNQQRQQANRLKQQQQQQQQQQLQLQQQQQRNNLHSASSSSQSSATSSIVPIAALSSSSTSSQTSTTTPQQQPQQQPQQPPSVSIQRRNSTKVRTQNNNSPSSSTTTTAETTIKNTDINLLNQILNTAADIKTIVSNSSSKSKDISPSPSPPPPLPPPPQPPQTPSNQISMAPNEIINKQRPTPLKLIDNNSSSIDSNDVCVSAIAAKLTAISNNNNNESFKSNNSSPKTPLNNNQIILTNTPNTTSKLNFNNYNSPSNGTNKQQQQQQQQYIQNYLNHTSPGTIGTNIIVKQQQKQIQTQSPQLMTQNSNQISFNNHLNGYNNNTTTNTLTQMTGKF
jgi:hypothetical protein